MNLVDVIAKFSTDEQCRELLKRLRWPTGPECLQCGGKNLVRLRTKKHLLWCRECRYQFTVTSNTVFHDSHLSLDKWFIATLLMCESRKGFSANEMKRVLGISYKTAWYLCHRIRHAMNEVQKTMLDGTVEIDETYVGGVKRGCGLKAAKAAKEVVIGIRQRSGALRFFHADDAKSGTLAKYIRENISQDVEVVVTDEWAAYVPAMIKAKIHGNKHETIQHKKHVYAVGDVHTNTVESAFSLLKRGIMGTWHKVSAKHLASYLDEMTFRFNRRKSDVLFLDTLRHMVTAPVLTFEKLTA
jgi:transposase-like protein